MDANSLQAELQRKKSELARLQQQVLRAETSRTSQRTKRKAQQSQNRHSKKGSKSTVHDGKLGSEAAHSVDVKKDTSKTESLLTGETRTSTSGRKRLPRETINIPKTTPLSQPISEVKSASSECSSTVTDLLSVEDQSLTEYKHEMKILSQAGSLVRDSEDPHSPIWLKGFDYPAQYLVRQTRSMSAKISSQGSDTDATRPKETKGEDASRRRKNESLQQCGGRRKRGRGRNRKTKRDSPDPTGDGELQQQSCSSSSRTCSDLEELIVSIPIFGKFPISVRHASKALQQDSTSTCTPPEAQRQDVKQLVFPKPTSSPQPVEDFYLPDEGFQGLKLDKLQSVQQFGEKLRRKLKPPKLMSSKLRHGFSDTYSSQSEVESCTFTADVRSELTQVSCVVGSDSDSQLPFTEAEQEMLNVGVLSSKDMFVSCSLCDVSTSTSLHCVCNRTDGSEVVKTARLRHVVCLHHVTKEAITDHSTAEPLRTLHTTVDTETTVPYVAALEAGKISVYSEQYKCSWTTPGTNWKKNLWCLGEGELLQESCLLCANGDLLLVVGGTLQGCIARAFINGGKEKQWYAVNLQRTPPATNRSLQCSVLCSWVSGVRSSHVTVVSQSLPTDGATQALDVWKLQKNENQWCVSQWFSCPLPSSVTQLTSLNHVERTDCWVVGVADLTALLWDTAEGVLLKTVALGCSKPQPHPLTLHPVGVAAFNEKDTILLLLGCKQTQACPPLGEGSSPPLSDTPACACWLLAFEVNGSDRQCRLLQSYRPPTADPHHTGSQQWYCWRETEKWFLTAVSGNLVLTWNLLSPTPCEEVVITGDGGELISLKSARWLQEGRTLLTIDSSGEIHIFSKQG